MIYFFISSKSNCTPLFYILCFLLDINYFMSAFLLKSNYVSIPCRNRFRTHILSTFTLNRYNFSSTITNAASFTIRQSRETNPKTNIDPNAVRIKLYEDDNPINVILENIPKPYHTVDKNISNISPEFTNYCNKRNLEIDDGLHLHDLMHHILCGGFPDFPRTRNNTFNNNEDVRYSTKVNYNIMPENERNINSLQEYTKDYWTSINTQAFLWLMKQKRLYYKREIHPWIHYKLSQLNVTLEWLMVYIL